MMYKQWVLILNVYDFNIWAPFCRFTPFISGFAHDTSLQVSEDPESTTDWMTWQMGRKQKRDHRDLAPYLRHVR